MISSCQTKYFVLKPEQRAQLWLADDKDLADMLDSATRRQIVNLSNARGGGGVSTRNQKTCNVFAPRIVRQKERSDITAER